MSTQSKHQKVNPFHQPKSAYAVAFACVVAFMGIGLVDPILKSIGEELHATASQVELLFTSYMLVTGVAMLITGFISSRIGPKATILVGLLLIIIFAFLGGISDTVGQIVGFRAGWGLGNALFISTALAAIVSVATGGAESAIILYEAALGLGMAVGPLVGGTLGSFSWRGPFFGVSVLMAIGFIAILVLLKGVPKPKQKTSIVAPFVALKHRGLLSLGITALLYNFGFFTLLAYSPFVLSLDAIHVGYVFFFWGVLLAICSVFVAPKLERKFGVAPTLYGIFILFGLDLIFMAIFTNSEATVIGLIIIAGAFLGINNTLITTAVMEVSPVERGVASSAYSFVRFVGGAIAPWLAGKLAEWYNPHIPFLVGGIIVFLAMVTLTIGKRDLNKMRA
ncbi:MFS family permease [Pullulanibacillus pueri]|uniref:Multidrug efflux protein YfmO n=1 Tax=Pullulanibacillus pueri TaxID=1437324 RepID=A0A8J3ELQ4_9BACL|nr:MFS transporter [Pullulanibacillus pueri]MBM7681185.1 MFS family permease [Pullulanibacillus pueri]GGH77381.1 multidrug efflux protein YfmO [Pullulanibacillus pueri]